MKASKGFTLVEILIVVIILGILAAIVIPQFSSASDDARQSALVSDLQTLRSQLELYKVQHLDYYPDVHSLTAGVAWVPDTGALASRLSGTTDMYGQVAGTDFGPYLQKIPTNPFAPSAVNDTIRVDGAAAGTAAAGWRFDTTTGQIAPDDAMDCGDGTAHSAL